MPLADTLLRLASSPRLYSPKWKDQIMAEVSRNLQENFGLTAEKVQYRESEIRRHFPEGWVDGYESLIPVMTNQEKDRHALAAAVRARSEVIVTYNIKDFPRASLTKGLRSIRVTWHSICHQAAAFRPHDKEGGLYGTSPKELNKLKRFSAYRETKGVELLKVGET
jgi:hypothetical protein